MIASRSNASTLFTKILVTVLATVLGGLALYFVQSWLWPSRLPVIYTFEATPQEVAHGSPTTLKWRVENADSVVILPGLGSVPLASSHTVRLQTTTDYVLQATNVNGVRTFSVTVKVEGGLPPDLEKVVVPNVIGLSVQVAQAELDRARLESGSVQRRSTATAEPGTVLSQTPAPGQRVAPGTTVNLVVALESGEVRVPDVVGLPLQTARTTLRNNNLEPGSVQYKHTGTAEPGTVLTQTPVAGQRAAPGSIVTLVVAREFERRTDQTGRLTGYVLWGDVPVSSARIELKQVGGYYNMPVLVQAITAEDGRFTLNNAPTGSYMLYAVSPSDVYWGWTGRSIKVSPDAKVDVGTFYLKKKLQTLEPPADAIVETKRPTLRWSRFPNAVRYHVDVFNKETHQAVLRQDTRETSLTMPKPLILGVRYEWSVEAYNAADVSIAYGSAWRFTVQQ